MPQKPTKKINQEKIEQVFEDSIEKANSPSKAPSKPTGEVGSDQKKSFREQMGPAEAIGVPCLVTIILIILFMVFIGVVVKLSLNQAGL